MHMDIRSAQPNDIAAVLALWRDSAASTSTDTAEALTGLQRRDPGALLVAEESGHVVGSVIAAWDGWRGSIYRLVVDPAHRRSGLGGRLLRHGELRLEGLGARRMHAIVMGTDASAVAFWESTGWRHQSGQLRYARG
jgi:ribosomal protein S18 acetylase RimI-like enzyme